MSSVEVDPDPTHARTESPGGIEPRAELPDAGPNQAPAGPGRHRSGRDNHDRRRIGPVAEGWLALLLGALLAVIMRRPADLSTSVPQDAGDPVLVSWILAWPAHALTSFQSLFDSNTFAPLDNSLAFSDPLLGYLPFGLIGEGPAAAIVRYNIVYLFTFALAFAGTWVLVRQLGLGRTAALVAGIAFAFNPWRMSQLGHLQVLSSGAIPLALALLARGHGIRLRLGQGPVRPWWAFAGWAAATWHISLGFGLGLQVAYVLGICTAVAIVRVLLVRRRGGGWPVRGLLVADAVGIVLMLSFSAWLALPFLQVVEDHPQVRRSVAELDLYSPPPSSLVTAPAESWAWGRVTAPAREGVVAAQEKSLFPGLVVTGLAVVGLWSGVWSVRRRIVLAGTTVTLAVLALGTAGPFGGRGYLLLYDFFPGMQAIRTPGRLATTAWLALAVLAAHGVVVLSRLLQDFTRRRELADRGAVAVGLAGVLTALVLLEGVDTSGLVPVPPPPSVALADVPGPVMVLPSEDGFDLRVMNWSTDRFPDVVNGSSGFTPVETAELRDAAAALPDPAALERLRRSGVRTLLVLPDQLPGTRYEALNIAGLGSLPGVVVDQRAEVVVVSLGP